jgi:hypothetical protein
MKALAVFVLAAAALAGAAYATRWQVVSAGQGQVYMVNRWTDDVLLLRGNGWERVRFEPPPP